MVLISSVIVGLVVGLIAHLLVGRSRSAPIWLSLVVGVVAAYLGTWIARLVGVPTNTSGIDFLELVVQIVVAAILVPVAVRLFPTKAPLGTHPPDPRCTVCRGSGTVIDGKYSLPTTSCECTRYPNR